jgi:DNA primase
MKPEREAGPKVRVADLLETFFRQTRLALSTQSKDPDAREVALSFLSARGFDRQRIPHLPMGLFTDGRSIQRGLAEAGFSPQEIEASALVADERLAGRLIGPIRDPRGAIVSFWARYPGDRPPRLLFKGPWKEATALVGLDVAFDASGHRRDRLDELVVFERLFDALLLQSWGLLQAAAIAGPAKDMTRERWQRLAALRVCRVALVPDRNEASRSGLLIALENAFRAKLAPDVFVVLPESWGGHSTAVEFLRARGPSAFHTVVQNDRVSASSYMALASPKGSLTRARTNGYCRHHQCDTSVCFCFD